MRKFDVAYNPPLPNWEAKKKWEEMDVDELAEYIRGTCAKSKGDIMVCDKCRRCLQGRKLMDMLGANDKKGYDISGILKMKNLPVEEKMAIARKTYADAMKSGDPVKYIMDKDGISMKQARARIYQYRHKYGDSWKEHEEKPIAEVKTITVDELVNSLLVEKKELEKRIVDIDNAINVIRMVKVS